MSRFGGIFDIASTELRLILLIFVATDSYSLFTKSVKKVLPNVQNEGGGVRQLLEHSPKNCRIGFVGHP